ncbi:MAG: class I SAM-dependent methyltransferase [Candidatus Omnitrophica bacterium]|nr:class I SAM-dependent methyltransferase [Candidatus Omnitrophota bacterium]
MMDSLSGEETLDLKLFEQATVFYLYDITGKTYIDDPLRRNISKLVGSLRFFADLRGLTGKPLPRLVDVGPTLTVNARPHSLDGELKKISDLGQNIIFYEVLPLSARSGKRSQDGQSTPSGKSELRPATETQTPIAAGIEKWIEFLRVKLPYLFSQGGKEAVSYVDFGSGTGGFIGEINELFEASGFFVRNGIGIEYSDVAARAAALSGFNVIEGDVTKYRELSRSYRELQEGASDIVFMNAPDFIRMDDEEILEWYEAAQFFLKPGGIILMRLYNYSHVDDETERLKRQRAETELFRGFFERHTDRINYELVPAGERPVLPRGHHQLREDLYVIRLNPQPSQETPVQPESEAQKVKPELRISAGETVEAAAGLIPGDLRSDLREALPELAAASPEKTAHVTFMRVSQNGIAPTMEEYRAAATNAIAQILTDQARSETTVLETIHANNLFLRDGLTRVLQHYFSTQTPDQKASFVMDVAEGTSLQTVSPLLKATLMGRAHLIDGLFLSSLDASRGSSLLSRVFSLVRGLGFNNVTMDRSLDSAKWERESHEGPMAVVTLNQPSVKAPIPEGFTLVTHSEDDSLAFEALSGEEQEALILLKQFEAIALWLGTTAAELLKDDPALFQFFQYHTNKNGLISFDLVRFHTEMRTAREFQTAA